MMRLLHDYVDIQKNFFIDLSRKFKEKKIEISNYDLEKLKTYIRIPSESNRVAFVNILEKYIFTYNIKVDDFNVSQYLLVESSLEFQQNANTFLTDYLKN